MERKPTAAIFLLAALSLAWGMSWPTMKTVVGELPIFTFRMLTAWGGGVCVLLVTGLIGNGIWLHKRDVGPAIIAGLLNISGWLYFTALGLSILPAGRAAVLAYTMPLWAFLAGIVLMREPVTKKRIVSLFCGLGAVLVLAGDDIARFGGAPLGVLAVLAAAACWGVGTVIQKKVPWRTPLFTVAAWQLLIGGIPLATMAFLHDTEPYKNLTLGGALGMAYVILIATVFGYWAWFGIVRLVPTSIASLGILPVPLLGVSASTLALGEPLGWPELAALVLATTSLAIILPMPRFRRR
jgi:drug/metabolite transporter (DMT)-like permease